jgi:Organic solute transporter Ostalpha
MNPVTSSDRLSGQIESSSSIYVDKRDLEHESVLASNRSQSGNENQESPNPVRRNACVKYSGMVVLLLYSYGVLQTLGLVFYLFTSKNDYPIITTFWSIAGLFVAITLPVAFMDIHNHCTHYVSPIQRHYMRILLLVPIYSIESWLALRYYEYKTYFETLREMYEAYYLYEFYVANLELLGGRERIGAILMERSYSHVHHMWPLSICWREGWNTGVQFVDRVSFGVYQHIIIRIATSILAIVFEAFDLFDRGSYAVDRFYLYETIILIVSKLWTVYCINQFFHELEVEMKPISPNAKLWIERTIIFFCFVQALIIEIILLISGVNFHINNEEYISNDEITQTITDFIIVIEMFFIALLMHKYYGYQEFYSADPNVPSPYVVMKTQEVQLVRRLLAQGRSAGAGRGAPAPMADRKALELTLTAGFSDRTHLVQQPSIMSVSDAFNHILPHDLIKETKNRIDIFFARMRGVVPVGVSGTTWVEHREELDLEHVHSLRTSGLEEGVKGAGAEVFAVGIVDETGSGGSSGSLPGSVLHSRNSSALHLDGAVSPPSSTGNSRIHSRNSSVIDLEQLQIQEEKSKRHLVTSGTSMLLGGKFLPPARGYEALNIE